MWKNGPVRKQNAGQQLRPVKRRRCDWKTSEWTGERSDQC